MGPTKITHKFSLQTLWILKSQFRCLDHNNGEMLYSQYQ